MDLDLLLLLLVSIKNNKDSDESLVDNNLKNLYSNDLEVGYICNYALKEGYIINEYEKFTITSKGIEKINEINNIFERKGIDRFIVPYSKYKIRKMNIDDIYIPKKK
ncbi:hypothetical protein [Paraclostridium sordellii]|uniref:hypothetical protein n=1 Tax=Paraclostridium sordellii TaxID=1505 RepID=UPI0005E997F2|nr:hypothetical protein [Paeniclostridium sordellii]CEN85133.1 Uncharacterised protein [[Clostridium] sordellii] [Paeniclostridium sordellii]